ncbi:MAG: hypothetical protein L3J79_00245, partial [Candidatus Marinimicrobia bacterium]|nr:hypothetical protein [Candidatus Neomarinimicrobiota bacterium]
IMEKDQKYPYWYDFNKAFKAATDQTLADFNEEWRRVMNTYYYGYKAQKEMISEIGEPLVLKGFSRVLAASISPDSSKIAVVGRTNSKMQDYGLYVMSTDSTHKIEEVHYGRFSGIPAWSPDAKQIIISEYHRGSNGSLLNDLRLVELATEKIRWITHDLRSLHSVFSHSGKGVFFVAHPGETSQIHYLELSSSKQIQISKFVGDVQIQSLNLAPDGQKLTFMIQEESGDVNIAIINRDGSGFKKVTDHPEEDLLPVWRADGQAIIYTSFRNSTPNLYRVALDSLRITQMTDVAEGIYSRQRLPGTNQIIASTLADVDTVRLRIVDADRVAPELVLNLREPYTAWRTKAPDVQIPATNYAAKLVAKEPHSYKALKSVRPLLHLIWPDAEGVFAVAAYNDALGKHLYQGGGVVDWSGALAGGYLGYTNLQFQPVLNFYASKNFSFNLRRTWGATNFEVLGGVGVMALLPMNSGNSLSSNHDLMAHLRLVKRTVLDAGSDNWVRDLSFPQSKETNLSLTWRWLKRRPGSADIQLPTNGVGVLAHIESTIPEIWGNGDYQKIWAEGFFNQKIPKTPFVLYNRSKWERHTGNILAQDSIGFMSTAPLYFSPGTILNVAQAGIFDLPESYNLRGQTGDHAASELIYNVTELRIPLMRSFPAQFFMLQFTGFTGALFHDLGYLPETDEVFTTMGAELKFNLSIGKIALITLSTGLGGNADYWEMILEDPDRLDIQQDSYFRLALVNPF